MDKSNEFLAIPKCPSCGKPHKYSLVVMRSSYMFSASNSDPSNEKRVRRLFSCPKTGIDFEGMVILKDDPKNKIVSITVQGIMEEEE